VSSRKSNSGLSKML